jgi:hypothetical protein
MNKSYVETLEGAELLVSYEYDEQPTRVEECHGYHYFDDSSIVIKSVEVVISGIGIDITASLTEKQIRAIAHDLKLEDA